MTFELYQSDIRGELVDLDVTPGDPLSFHQGLPHYRVTDLFDAPLLAADLGVARVLVKDESERLGLPAFKMLGASWATARAIQREWFPDLTDLTIDGLRSALAAVPGRELVAATDGNHGRGVARMAKLLGLSCRIFVPAGTAASRIQGIESEGAVVTVVDGTYDDAIERSASAATDTSLVISDTSWEGYKDTPSDVIVGYSTMFREIDATLEASGLPQPDVVLFQSGVGSFAAAGLRHYRSPSREHHPRTVIVEPLQANCLYRSARAGGLTEAPGPHSSSMAGLNCGLPSQLAWPVVQSSADVYMGIDDTAAYAAMRLLADAGIVSGESGAAAIGALLALKDDPEAREALGITPDSVVLVVNTEGATDPANFESQVGTSPDDVMFSLDERRRASKTTAV